MNVFVDFEASSLADQSYPIEVAWVFEDGRCESYLIAPAPGWSDWDPDAERIHGIARETLVHDGTAHEIVAGRMVETLSGHALFASAAMGRQVDERGAAGRRPPPPCPASAGH